MKKLLLKGSVFMIYAVLLEVVFPMAVDPFNVFHVENIRLHGTQTNSNYIKMKYILNHKEDFDGYVFIFGSSRVGYINPDKMPESKIFNMTYSDGIPAEHLANLHTFLKNNVHPSKIYLGVDMGSYESSVADHINMPLRCPYEFLCNDPLHFFSLYMNPASTINVIASAFGEVQQVENSDGSFYRIGTTIHYGRKTKFNWSSVRVSNATPPTNIKQKINDTLRDIQELADICQTSGIDLVIFTNALYHITYISALRTSYLDFLEGLAEISDFWNFSSINDITMSNDLYLEPSHYKAEVGDMMIDAMCYGKADPKLQAQGFGFKVTRENVKDFIAMLKQQAESFTQKNSPAN